MHAATHILQEKTHVCGVLKRHNFRVHVSLGSAETLVRRNGIINHHSIAYCLSNISAKNYRNRLMRVKSIVCNISVVFWDTVYNTIPIRDTHTLFYGHYIAPNKFGWVDGTSALKRELNSYLILIWPHNNCVMKPLAAFGGLLHYTMHINRPLTAYTLDVAKMVAHCSIVSSRMDYANALLHDTSANNGNRLQVAHNSLAGVVCQTPRSARYRVTSAAPLVRQLITVHVHLLAGGTRQRVKNIEYRVSS